MPNILTSPEALAGWTNVASNDTANVITAPDGTLTADKLYDDATGPTTHYVLQSATTVTSTQYAFSAFISAADYNYAALYVGGANKGKFFDLANKTELGNLVGAPLSSGVEEFSNNWLRCHIVISASSTSQSFRLYLSKNGTSETHLGDNSSGIYAWGLYANEGTTPETYVSQAGITVTSSTPRLIRGVTRNITRDVTKNLIDF